MGNFAVVDEQPADTAIGQPVLSGVADGYLSAVAQAQEAGTLDMEKEQIDRIFDPGNFEIAPAQHPKLIDLTARIIRHQDTVLDPATYRFAAIAGVRAALVLGNQIGRHGINRIIESFAGRQTGLDHRLIIAGKEDIRFLRCCARWDEIEAGGDLARQTIAAGPAV